MSDEQKEVSAPQMIDLKSGQVMAGFEGKLYVVYGNLLFPFEGARITLNDQDGKMIFHFQGEENALVLDIMKNENVLELVNTQLEGENMTRSVLITLRDTILANYVNGTVAVMDLGAAMDNLGRKQDA